MLNKYWDITLQIISNKLNQPNISKQIAFSIYIVS